MNEGRSLLGLQRRIALPLKAWMEPADYRGEGHLFTVINPKLPSSLSISVNRGNILRNVIAPAFRTFSPFFTFIYIFYIYRAERWLATARTMRCNSTGLCAEPIAYAAVPASGMRFCILQYPSDLFIMLPSRAFTVKKLKLSTFCCSPLSSSVCLP